MLFNVSLAPLLEVHNVDAPVNVLNGKNKDTNYIESDIVMIPFGQERVTTNSAFSPISK